MTSSSVVDDAVSGVGDRLEKFLVAQLGSDAEVRIEGLRRTSAGFSRENWVFDATWREPSGDARACWARWL